MMKIQQIFQKIITFLKEVKLEIKKINWPSKQETLKYILVVIGVSLGIAAYLGGLDFIFVLLLEKFVF